MNRPFKILFSVIFFVVIISFGSVFLLEDDLAATDIWFAVGGCLFTMGLMIWIALDIRYEFKDDHLYLRAGCFYTRIRYEDIESYRQLNSLMDSMSGFNLQTSTKAIEILSQKVMLGAVRISPSDREGFIQELEKRMQAVK